MQAVAVSLGADFALFSNHSREAPKFVPSKIAHKPGLHGSTEKAWADFWRILLTDAHVLRLCNVAGLSEAPRPSDDPALRTLHRACASAVARIEPTVTEPTLDTLEAHVGSVYRYALRLTGKTDLAEELAQETMLRGWQGRHKLRDMGTAQVWLLRIATNIWTDQLRSLKTKLETLQCDPPCVRPSPSLMNDAQENVKTALAAIDELPPRQRQVMYLVTCETLSIAEVAEVLEINESAVKSTLSVARKEIRRRLKDLYEEICGRPCQKP